MFASGISIFDTNITPYTTLFANLYLILIQCEGVPFSQRGPQNFVTFRPEGAPYLHDFGTPGPQNLKVFGLWGPQNWGAPFSHDTGPEAGGSV